MTDNNSDLVKDWYRFAIMDYSSAKHLNATMNPKPLEIICYHCQQSVEKILKGFLISNNIVAPKTHDLQQLRIMCVDIDNDFEDLEDVCMELNPYGVQPRYPNEIEILETDTDKALQNVNIVIKFFETSKKGILT
jgi:HEPN domain-containing protein